MINNSSNFSSFTSREGFGPFYWWMGQIVDEKNWDANTSDVQHNRNEIPGWGYRYKVRIFGRDSLIKDVPDDQLEMAEVLYPVTAGSGHGGSGQTPNLRQGTYVIGFYKDGKNARQPMIMGVIGNNSQTELPGSNPQKPLDKRSGWFSEDGTSPIPNNKVWREPGNSKQPAIDSAQEVGHKDQRLKDQWDDGTRKAYVPPTYGCDGSSGGVQGIQIAIQSALGLINKIRSSLASFSGAVSDLQNSITGVINNFSAVISNTMKTIYNRMRGFVNNAVSKGLSLAASIMPPFLRHGFDKVSQKSTDLLQCAFNTVISSLLSLVTNSMTKAVTKAINAPMCAVEKFTSSILMGGLGSITSTIGSVMGGISSLMGSVGKINFSGGFGVMDIVSGALKFLTCSETLNCNMSKEWTLWYGSGNTASNLGTTTVNNLSNTINGIFGGSSKKSSKTSSSSSTASCDSGPQSCGPPQVIISGGGGTGAKANAIISSTGKLLGVDFVSYGSGYTSTPTVQVYDPCGKGGGAVVVPVMGFPLSA